LSTQQRTGRTRRRNGLVQIVTTVATKPAARRLATALLDARLAACVQIEGPLESLYWWRAKREHSREWRCVIKAPSRVAQQVIKAVQRLHPYDTPEILVFAADDADSRYLRWAEEVTRRPG
jgi:periplasmic divalent cation tolerance protein